MKRIALFVCMVVTIVSVAVNIYAQVGQEPAVSPNPLTLTTYRTRPLQIDHEFLSQVNLDKGGYSNTWAQKMGVGVINTTTAWTEIPKEMGKVSEESNLLIGCTFGFGKGLVSGFARGVSGVVDIATFSLPPYDEPLMKPEYKVNRPEEGFKINLLEW